MIEYWIKSLVGWRNRPLVELSGMTSEATGGNRWLSHKHKPSNPLSKKLPQSQDDHVIRKQLLPLPVPDPQQSCHDSQWQNRCMTPCLSNLMSNWTLGPLPSLCEKTQYLHDHIYQQQQKWQAYRVYLTIMLNTFHGCLWLARPNHTWISCYEAAWYIFKNYYLFMLAVLGLHYGTWAFSSCGTQAEEHVGSLVVPHRLSCSWHVRS